VKLYYFPPAPNPRKVCTYLAEKGIELEKVQVNLLLGEQRSPEHLARNPQGKLPVLELDDGSTIAESLPIIEYLEELHPEPVMIGETPEERAHVRSIERIADLGVLIPAARCVHAIRSPLGLPANPEVAKDSLESVHRGMALLDEGLATSPFLAGDRVTIADCTLWGAVTFAGFFGIEIDDGHPNVQRWKRDFFGRPSAQLPA
jgi:glutathione S-transferase